MQEVNIEKAIDESLQCWILAGLEEMGRSFVRKCRHVGRFALDDYGDEMIDGWPTRY